MLLGDLIRRLADNGTAADALQGIGDLVLLGRVAEQAAAFDESPGEYVAASAGRFAAVADDEAWLRVIGEAEQAPDPGAAALRVMLRWALDADAHREPPPDRAADDCRCGSRGHPCHGPD